MASSRVYVRIHHASDVVGGVATGLVIGTAARAFWKRVRRRLIRTGSACPVSR